MPNKLTQDEFIRRAKIVHGDKYDYSKVNYMGAETKVCIICPKHGEPEYNVGVELNGRQHYVPVEKFGGEEGLKLTRDRDLMKYSNCKKNGIKLFYYTPPNMKSYICDYFEKVYTSFDELITDIKKYNGNQY